MDGVSGLWRLSVSSSLVSELGVKVATGAVTPTVLGDDISIDGDGILEFRLRLRLGLGGPSPCSSLLSSSSSSSLSSSWIWLRTGALMRDVSRLPEEDIDGDEEEGLQRNTT